MYMFSHIFTLCLKNITSRVCDKYINIMCRVVCVRMTMLNANNNNPIKMTRFRERKKLNPQLSIYETALKPI